VDGSSAGRYDRGHLVPNADRNKSDDAARATFYMTNMIPEDANLNQQAWKVLEKYARDLVDSGNTIYAYAGGYGKIGQISRISPQANFYVDIPERVWKILVIVPKGKGPSDFNQSNVQDLKVLAVDFPNTPITTSKNPQWTDFLTTVNDLEAKLSIGSDLKYDFLAPLDDSIEEQVENTLYDVSGVAQIPAISPGGVGVVGTMSSPPPAFSLGSGDQLV
jgi:endonuclease G